jgi:hypothetical protein
MDQPAGLSEPALAQALDPRHFVQARAVVYGGPAPADVQLQIGELTTALERDESLHKDAADHLLAAAALLRDGITRRLEPTEPEVPPHG